MQAVMYDRFGDDAVLSVHETAVPPELPASRFSRYAGFSRCANSAANRSTAGQSVYS